MEKPPRVAKSRLLSQVLGYKVGYKKDPAGHAIERKAQPPTCQNLNDNMAEIIALIAGPMLGVLFTVIFTVIYQRQDFLRKQKLNIFNALMANRMNFSNLDFIRALAMIDVVFDKHAKVLEKWHGFYDAALTRGSRTRSVS
jgi:hypothetical protein